MKCYKQSSLSVLPINLLSECLCFYSFIVDVYKPAGVIAEKRKQLEASEQGGKFINATWSQTGLSVNCLLFIYTLILCFTPALYSGAEEDTSK